MPLTDRRPRWGRWLLALSALIIIGGGAVVFFRLQSARQPAQPSRIYFSSVRNGREELFSMNPDGSGQQRLVATPKLPGDRTSHNAPFGLNFARPTAVSPDGTRIACTISTGNGKSKKIYLVNPDGTQRKFVTEGEEAAFTPDGRALTFLWRGKPYQCRLDGSGRGQRMGETRQVGDLSVISPDGRLTATCTMPLPGEVDIYLQDRRGHSRLLTRENGLVLHLAFSPDSRQLAFDLLHEEHGDIYVIDLDGTNRRALTASGHDWCPVWGVIPVER